MAASENATIAMQERLDFMGLDDRARRTLRDLKPVIEKAVGPALAVFYDKVKAHPHTRGHFSGDAQMSDARGRQEKHWGIIASADFGEDYARAVRAVGRTHARLGLEPRWYIGGYTLVTEQLIDAIVREMWPRGFAMRSKPEPASAALGSLMKAVMLDIDLAISTYLESIDEGRQKAEQARLETEARQTEAMKALSDALGALAGGDLTVRIDAALAPEFDSLKNDFNGAIASLEKTIAGVAEAAHGIGGSSDEIGQASDDLSRRTEQQAASLEETAAAVEQLTASVRRAADGASQAAAKVMAAKKDANHSGEIVRTAVTAMSEIEKSSREISQIIGVIDEIAFQTNLLALNAGVEAARAGEAGRGFAVVAQEVRALAQRSAEAAREIKALISTSTGQVGEGVRLMAETGQASERIIEQVNEIDALVADIANSSKEQSTGLSEVNIAINQMDQSTQQNAAMVEETTAAVHSLRSEASELVRTVSGFRIAGAGVSRTARSQPAKPSRPRENPPLALKAYGTNGSAAHSTSDGWEEF